MKDQKRFYDIVKTEFTGKSKLKENITLIEKDELISGKTKVAEILNNNFVDAVPNLGIKKSVYVEKIASIGSESMEQKIDKILESYTVQLATNSTLFCACAYAYARVSA